MNKHMRGPATRDPVTGKPIMRISREQGEKKPPHGAPCNNCGICCMAALCPLAKHLFGGELGPCPALLMDDGKSQCGVVANPAAYINSEEPEAIMREYALEVIGARTGCDCRINGEPTNKEFYRALEVRDAIMRSKRMRARKAWGMS